MFGITGSEILSGLRRYGGRFAGGVPVIGNQLQRQISPTYDNAPAPAGSTAAAGDYATPGSAGAASIARAQGAGVTPTQANPAMPASTSRRRGGIYGIAQDFVRGGQGGTRY